MELSAIFTLSPTTDYLQMIGIVSHRKYEQQSSKSILVVPPTKARLKDMNEKRNPETALIALNQKNTA